MVDWLEITVRQPGYRTSYTSNLETGSASATLRDHELVVVKLILMFFVLIPQSGKTIYFLAPALTCPPHPPPIQASTAATRRTATITFQFAKPITGMLRGAALKSNRASFPSLPLVFPIYFTIFFLSLSVFLWGKKIDEYKA